MTITTYLLSKLDLSAPKRWLAGKVAVPSTPNRSLVLRESMRPANAMFSTAPTAYGTSAPPAKMHHPKPLRVVRVVEQGQARHHVGRMVISGSMADVCAELDRLAAFEPA